MKETVRQRDELRLLLVQVRKDQAMKLHEVTCFETSGNLRDDQLLVHDLLVGPIGADMLASVDGMIIGGSGDYSVLDEVPHIDSLFQAVIAARERGLPLFGSCWGGQAMTLALGGEVVHDPDRSEVGTILVSKESGAAGDPVFGDLPIVFAAQAGHKDRVTVMPPGAVCLARSEICPVQAFVLPGNRIYATQFHPEMDKQDVLLRLEHYSDNYVSDQASVDRIKAGLRDSPEAAQLIGRWIDRVIMA